MKKISQSIIIIFFFLICGSITDSFAQDNKFIGVKICSACHKGEKGKMIYDKWLKTKHAEAYKRLQNEKSKEIAKKKGLKKPPTEAQECLKCHATGYFDKDQRLASSKKEDGVTCEACHGPGSAYKSSHGKEKKEEGVKKGLILGTGDEKICKKCHNPESPTFAGFNYKRDWEKIKH
jgi:DnaJ-class molecular chaperone